MNVLLVALVDEDMINDRLIKKVHATQTHDLGGSTRLRLIYFWIRLWNLNT